jgi:hypothetical protein
MFYFKLTYDFIDTFFRGLFLLYISIPFCFQTRGQKFTLRYNSDLSFAALEPPAVKVGRSPTSHSRNCNNRKYCDDVKTGFNIIPDTG